MPLDEAHKHLSGGQWALFLAIVAVLVVVNALFAASETALLSVRDTRISQLIDEGDRRARAVQRLRERKQTMLVSIQIVVTLVTTLTSALATEMMPQVFVGLGATAAVVITTFSVAFLLSLFGEITPKNWAVAHAERIALGVAPTIRISTWILRPFVWVLETVSGFIIRLFGQHRPTNLAYPTEEEIRLIVEQGAEFGELEEEEKEMIHNVMEIPNIAAREIMTPRTQIAGVDIQTPISEVVDLVLAEGHTRIPVFRNTIDDIVGILHAKDLLFVLRSSNNNVPLESLMKKPLQIPESKKVDKLLQEFKATKSQMAVVLDEYGGTAGVVTMEDVLEEIVGPIEDEYDVPEEREIEMVAPGEYVIAGSAALEDVAEKLNLQDLEDEEMERPDTIGGLVFSLLGRVAEVDDSVEYGGWRMVVEAIEGRRIGRLRLTQLDADTGTASAA